MSDGGTGLVFAKEESLCESQAQEISFQCTWHFVRQTQMPIYGADSDILLLMLLLMPYKGLHAHMTCRLVSSCLFAEMQQKACGPRDSGPKAAG